MPDTYGFFANRITSASGPGSAKTYTYDKAGNQTSAGTVTSTNSPHGRISSFKYGGTILGGICKATRMELKEGVIPS